LPPSDERQSVTGGPGSCGVYGSGINCTESIELKDSFRPGWASAAVVITLAVASILSLTRVSEFLYFNF